MISTSGPGDAKLMIVFDYPEKAQLSNRELRASYAWSYLRSMFEEVGLDYLNNAYVTCFIREYFDDAWRKGKKIPFYPAIVAKTFSTNYEELLVNEINAIKPNLVLTIGEAPFQMLTGNRNVKKFRGSILSPAKFLNGKLFSNGLKILPILGMRDIRENYSATFYTINDLRKIPKYQQTNQPFDPGLLLWICRDNNSLINYLNRNNKPGFVVTDVETFHHYVTCVGLSTDGREGVCIPLLDDRISDIQLTLMWKTVAEYLSCGHDIVNQNIYYDDRRLETHGVFLNKIVGDTMLLGSLVYPEFPQNLGFLNSIYTEIPYFKDEGKEQSLTGHSKRDQIYLYNAKDCVATHQIYPKQLKDAEELKVLDLYKRGTMKWYFMYKRLMEVGLYIDEDARIKKLDKYTQMYNEYLESLKKLCGKELNPNSPKQVVDICKELNIELKKERYTGRVRTDEKALDWILLNSEMCDEYRLILYQIIYARKVTKVCNFLSSKVYPDGTLRSRYNLSGTETGRTSTGKTHDYILYIDTKDKVRKEQLGFSFHSLPKRGIELAGGQVIAKDLRDIFVPPKGWVFGDGDLAQAEGRVVSLLCNNMEALEKYDENRPWTEKELQERETFLKNNQSLVLAKKPDVHVWTSSLVTGVQEHLVTQYEREMKGKRTRHAGNYDMTYTMLSEIAKIPESDAKVALKEFHEADRSVREVYHYEIHKLLEETRSLRTPQGRQRTFFGRLDGATDREGFAYIPQATVSDQLKFAMYATEEIIETRNMKWFFEAHDGGAALIKKDFFPAFAATFREQLEKEIDFSGCSIPRKFKLKIPAEIGYSDTTYGAMEDIK